MFLLLLPLVLLFQLSLFSALQGLLQSSPCHIDELVTRFLADPTHPRLDCRSEHSSKTTEKRIKTLFHTVTDTVAFLQGSACCSDLAESLGDTQLRTFFTLFGRFGVAVGGGKLRCGFRLGVGAGTVSFVVLCRTPKQCGKQTLHTSVWRGQRRVGYTLRRQSCCG